MTPEPEYTRSSSSENRRSAGGFLNDSLTKKGNLYEILGITKNATDDDIKRAYRRFALKYHPDKNQNNEDFNRKFQEINYANTILSNPSKRRIYDDYGDMGLKMADQLGEDHINIMLKPWLKWVFCSIFFLTCGHFDLSSNPEDPIDTQPQQQTSNPNQTDIFDTGENNIKFTIYEDSDGIKITKVFEPPPPYSESNPGNEAPTCSQAKPGTPPNYGATTN
uniref:J domain-containing protein n=1 Tax=Meloidogyne hapla TaxID=6305 RepID=A0A1I8BZC6_MELHA